MIYFLLIGDLIVSGFMILLVVRLLTANGREEAELASRIPLEDEHE